MKSLVKLELHRANIGKVYADPELNRLKPGNIAQLAGRSFL
ncbi:MAG: hypothetical protein ABR594_10335 [Pyrinomonadaceae bacterium]